jgi:hypothetical protein
MLNFFQAAFPLFGFVSNPLPSHPPLSPNKLFSGTIRVKNSCGLQVTVYWHYLLKITIKKQYNQVTLPFSSVAYLHHFVVEPDPALLCYADPDPGLALIPSQRRLDINTFCSKYTVFIDSEATFVRNTWGLEE